MALVAFFVGTTTIVGIASFAYTFATKLTLTTSSIIDKMDLDPTDGKIEFFGSQLGGQSVVTYSYTSDPWHLLLHDVYYFFAFWRNWKYIVWPVAPSDSGHYGELAPTKENLFCLAVHVVLIFAQLGFIISLPFMFVLPLWMVAAWVALFLAANRLVCHKCLNSSRLVYESDVDIGKHREDHRNEEQWIFLNGVAAGEHWLMSNLNRLSVTFKRPIMGIHNRTHGILFDTIECLIQRNFTYATSDVRMCYKELKEKLYRADLKRVIFILHSQGGIEGGLVLDWLIQELPQDLLMKLEVYTFGCAANHFNNPHRHILSQRIAQDNPAAITATTTTTTQVNTQSMTEEDLVARREDTAGNPVVENGGSPVVGRVASLPSAGDVAMTSPVQRRRTLRRPPTLITDASAVSNTSTVSAAADRAIGHIEHFAHTHDFVARWGVLHFASDLKHASVAGGEGEAPTTGMPRYMGRVFARSSDRGGHQFCQHYLDGMFPLEKDDEGNFRGAMEEGNEFMESEVRCREDDQREGDEVSSAATNMTNMGLASGVVGVTGFGSRRGTGFHVRANRGEGGGERTKKVKELSRLWGYVNGRSPADLRG
ncbi:hypothetical protein MKZ38_001878 [Zalerion maritima]|uniref:Uncharacterized protein n=1 Tax=Zalerion maritima TaxID=339359 RepID=A0AAD5RQY4_9PEZI|nr:hypothetical protein MKZ38_001878 [Zalerion maritima]